MDDILKRMLAVEDEADRIVSDAAAEAEKIKEAARQKANEIAAEAQSALAQEAESLVEGKVGVAMEGKKKALEKADRDMVQALAEFRAKVDNHLSQVTAALLFPMR